MSAICWDRYPNLAQSHYGRAWLTIQMNLCLAQNTIDAYGRALEDFLSFSICDGFALETATREHIARYVHDLSSRPNPPGAKIRVLDTGHGLANATLQQRLTAVRLFYDYLTEEAHCVTRDLTHGEDSPSFFLPTCLRLLQGLRALRADLETPSWHMPLAPSGKISHGASGGVVALQEVVLQKI